MDPNHSEEDVPSTSKCGTCEYESDDEKDMRSHIFATHVDVPSIFNCGTCTYTSDCEIDLQIHIDSSHTLFCDFCGFFSKSKDCLDEHNMMKHNFSCPTCTNIYPTPDKLNRHVCKLEIDNPSFNTFYSRGLFDLRGCNQINCSERDKQIAILHCDNCVENDRPCCWAPYGLSEKSEEVLHLQTKNFIEHT